MKVVGVVVGNLRVCVKAAVSCDGGEGDWDMRMERWGMCHLATLPVCVVEGKLL